jgi:hypothetical protein
MPPSGSFVHRRRSAEPLRARRLLPSGSFGERECRPTAARPRLMPPSGSSGHRRGSAETAVRRD